MMKTADTTVISNNLNNKIKALTSHVASLDAGINNKLRIDIAPMAINPETQQI